MFLKYSSSVTQDMGSVKQRGQTGIKVFVGITDGVGEIP